MARPPHITALIMARNESWCLGASVRTALQWCHSVYYLDHRSTDGSADLVRAIAAEFPGRVHVEAVAPADAGWEEMMLRQQMLVDARAKFQPTHFAIVDADEMLSRQWMDPGRIASLCDHTKPGQLIMLPQVAPYFGLTHRRVDGHFGQNSKITLLFGDRSDLKWANAHDGYCFHHRQPYNSEPSSTFSIPHYSAGGVIHLQFSSRQRLAWKAVWYKLTEVIKWPGRMTPAQLNQKYDWTLRRDNPQMENIPADWWPCNLQAIDLQTEPWQAEAARQLVAVHGRAILNNIETHGLPI